MAQTFRERVDAPDDTNDAREIWMLIRSWLTIISCLLYTSPSPRDLSTSRMPSSA